MRPDAREVRGPIRVAVLGAGVVGSQVIRLLLEHRDELAARIGAPLELAGVAVRRPNRHADVRPGHQRRGIGGQQLGRTSMWWSR
jgi:homoserine dehydrogenase